MRELLDWDKFIIDKFKANCSDGIYVDVGAYKGIYSEAFAQMATKVYAFEINPEYCNIIRQTNPNNVIVENIAITNKTSEIEYFGVGMYNTIGMTTDGIDSRKSGTIKSTSLDEYFSDIKVDYIKIDVEGAELEVIRGGLETIKNSKYCVIETHFDEDWDKIFNLLMGNGLGFRNLMDDELIFNRPCEAKRGISSCGRPYQIYLKR